MTAMSTDHRGGRSRTLSQPCSHCLADQLASWTRTAIAYVWPMAGTARRPAAISATQADRLRMFALSAEQTATPSYRREPPAFFAGAIRDGNACCRCPDAGISVRPASLAMMFRRGWQSRSTPTHWKQPTGSHRQGITTMTDRSTTTRHPAGIRAFVGRRPVTAFLIMAFAIAYPAMSLLALAVHRVIPGGPLLDRLPVPTGRNRRPDVDDVCPASLCPVCDLGCRRTTGHRQFV